jgi:hypothetical protein
MRQRLDTLGLFKEALIPVLGPLLSMTPLSSVSCNLGQPVLPLRVMLFESLQICSNATGKAEHRERASGLPEVPGVYVDTDLIRDPFLVSSTACCDDEVKDPLVSYRSV